ncbi:hypothetical protein Gotur_014293 [Gossypium turneri]
MVKDTLKEWPHMDEGYTAIALWNCSSNTNNFPDKVEFSKLKTLFLEGEWKIYRRDFLEVFGFPSLPNLKTLWCYNCMLKNFSSSLTNMRSLEILSLTGTEIDEISEEIVKLSALKYLRLSSVVEIAEELPNMVSRRFCAP